MLFAVIVKEQLTRQGKREKGGDLITEMHASKDQLPAETMGDYEGRMTQFGEYYVNFESIPAGFPPEARRLSRGYQTTLVNARTGDTSLRESSSCATRMVMRRL